MFSGRLKLEKFLLGLDYWNMQKNWFEAWESCRDAGLVLGSLDNEEETQLVSYYVNVHGRYEKFKQQFIQINSISMKNLGKLQIVMIQN